MALDIKLLEKLTSAFGPSGREFAVADLVSEELKKMKLKTKRDVHGSTRVTLGNSGKKILLAAHLDEIGLISTYIDKDGFIKASPVGFVYKEGLFGNRVQFENGTWGVISSEKTYPKPEIEMHKFFIDIGAKDRKEAEKLLPIGTFGVFARDLVKAANGRIISKALDDRIGVYVLLKVIKELASADLKDTVNFVFTVQEEFSGLGAATSAFGIAPHIAIAVDVTDSDDTRENMYLNMRLDSGPAIKIMDASLISHPKLKEHFISIAKKNKIPHQLEVLPCGGTDAGTMSLVKKGIPSIGISIPTRYIHTPSEMISSTDVENTIKLLVAAVKGKIGGAL